MLIDVRYADEDFGSNCAHYGIINGEIHPAEDDPDEYNDWSRKFAIELHGYEYEEYERERLEDERAWAEREKQVELGNVEALVTGELHGD